LFIDLKDTLLENTTYNFNFGNAIVDLNESNPLDSNLFVISTGTEIDSGIISGIVKDAYTQKPIKNATIVLYPAFIDSAIFKGTPSYISKTNAQGNYSLQYLTENKYQIFAIQYPGQEYTYQPYGNVGFHAIDVIPSHVDTVDFYLFKEIDTTQYISKSFSREYYSFVIGFHSPLDEPQFILTPDSAKYIVEEIAQDSFLFWIEGNKDIDSVNILISDSKGFRDTAKIDIKDKGKFYKKLKRKDTNKHPLTIGLNTKSNVLNYFDTLRINFSRPVLNWNLDSIFFIEGNDTIPLDNLLKANKIKMKLPSKKFGSKREVRSMEVIYKWEISKNYGFIFNSGAFTDCVEQTNDTIVKTFKTLGFEDYGSFRFTVTVPGYDLPLLLEVLDNDGKFVRDYTIKSGDVIQHPLAVPGKFKLRLILDRNGNKKWDTGNLKKKLQPEEIIYYNGVIEIRPNWDMEETWNVKLK
jgi:hypothetical protein